MTSTQDVLEKLGCAYFETDIHGAITAVNDTFCDLVGADCEQILGENLAEIFRSSGPNMIEGALDTIRDTGAAIHNLELEFHNRIDQQMLLEISIIPDIGEPGDGEILCGLVREITSRRETLESLHAAEHELAIGRRIQTNFLPAQIPTIAGWQINTHFEAAREVAGDFYDVFTLSSGRRVGLVMADVVDKGVGAALFMALFRSLIRAFVDQHYKLGWMDVLSSDQSSTREATSVGQRRKMLSTGSTALQNAIDLTNNFIAVNHGDSNMFATMFVGVLDPANGSLMYINGGHDPPILLRASGAVERLDPTGPAVGILPDMKFSIESTSLGEHDTLIAYTDGVPDALNPAGEPFGEDRLLALIKSPSSSAENLKDRIIDDLHAHIAGKSQYDDITMFVLRREPIS